MAQRKKTRQISTDSMQQPEFLDAIEHSLRTHYYRRTEPEYYASETYKSDFKQHSYERFRWAHDFVVPWISSKFDLSGKYLIEVGCGTGSSTLAFANVAAHVECFDIARKSMMVAKDRLAYWGLSNVNFREELFEKGATIDAPNGVDGVILFATLEHMTLDELIAVLTLSWEVIKPGGVIVVADTPNRFNPMDQHTSHLPLFSQLPREVRIRYADRSPRAMFREAIAATRAQGEKQAMERILRMGNGISFHEFELALGERVHDSIILTGHEKPLVTLHAVSAREKLVEAIFEDLKLQVSPAFTRLNLNFVMQKPLGA